MTGFDRKVLEAIEQRRLAPRPYAYFLAKRSVFWTLAGLSIVLGGVSVAVIAYRVADHLDTGGRGFDEMPFDDIAEFLPGVWLTCFVFFIASAVMAISRTRRGYRYRRLSVIGVAAGAAIALGLLLHLAGVGPAAHRFLAERSAAYRAFTYIPYDEWTRPDAGYLGGAVLAAEAGRSLRLRDFRGAEWDVDISAATILFDDPLVEEGDVAIRGERTGPRAFKAERIDAFD